MTGYNQPCSWLNTRVFVLLVTIFLSLLSACGLADKNLKPEYAKSHLDGRLAANSSIEMGTAFHHVVLTKDDRKQLQSPLRVYIEGDGKPFTNGTSIASDPTPRFAPMLALWELDHADAIYIGRPCYLGLAKLPECDEWVWTSGRYNELIVQSMQSLTERYSEGRPVVLIGHSGGGALAMLIADRMSRRAEAVTAVVTLSGNLDVFAWTMLHGYTSLHRSESPADKLPLPDDIAQLHVVAGRDTIVPPRLTRELADRLPVDSICEVPAYDHNCCWNHRWPIFLRALEKQLLTPGARLGAACTVF